MEIKKINRLLLGIFVLHIAIVALLTVFPDMFQIGIILNLSLGEIILFVPTLVYLSFWVKGECKEAYADPKPYADKESITITADSLDEQSAVITAEHLDEQSALTQKETVWKRLHFNNVKPSTFLYVLLFTWLSMPLTTLINAISMLFVDNTVASLSAFMLEIPFPIMLFLMAVTPAFCEEIVFRGVVYGEYRRDGNKFWAVILSGFMFGIMHMNLNQALYAFAIGILLALLFEATDSIVTTMLFHFIYNSQSCCLMYLVEAIMPGYYAEASSMAVTPEELYMMISVYLVIAAIATPLAICVLYKIAKNENRVVQLKETLPGKQEGKAKIATVSYILASVIAVGYIAFDIIAVKFMY